LVADTAALKSGSSASDGMFTATQARLAKLLRVRDDLATRIKNQLFRAAFANTPIVGADLQTARCDSLLSKAQRLPTAAEGL